MESINKLPGQIMGLEVLRFENAEIQKFRGMTPIFSGFGPLTVLYFPMYHRFVLQINDWKYPLLRRIPISGSMHESDLKSYTFPGPNGTSYELRILDNANLGALSNFEAVLMGSSRFSFKGEDISSRKYEASPDDKLIRQVKAQPGITDAISGTISGAFKSATDSIVAGTKKLTKKMRSNKSSIAMKDFKKDAKSSFKKDYFSSSQKYSEDFLNRRKNNAFLSTGKPIQDMMKASDKTVPALYFFQDEIEDSILSAKERFALPPSDQSESRGFMASLKSGISGMTEGISSRLHGGQERGRTTAEHVPTKLPEQEGMIHYQG